MNIVVRIGIIIFLICAAAFGNTWLFNHVNPWVSIIVTFALVITVLGLIANPIIKRYKQQNEEDRNS